MTKRRVRTVALLLLLLPTGLLAQPQHRTLEDDPQYQANLQRWRSLTEEQRQRIRDRARRVTPRQVEILRQRLEELRRLPAQERSRIEANHQKLQALPDPLREVIRQRYLRFQRLPEVRKNALRRQALKRFESGVRPAAPKDSPTNTSEAGGRGSTAPDLGSEQGPFNGESSPARGAPKPQQDGTGPGRSRTDPAVARPADDTGAAVPEVRTFVPGTGGPRLDGAGTAHYGGPSSAGDQTPKPGANRSPGGASPQKPQRPAPSASAPQSRYPGGGLPRGNDTDASRQAGSTPWGGHVPPGQRTGQGRGARRFGGIVGVTPDGPDAHPQAPVTGGGKGPAGPRGNGRVGANQTHPQSPVGGARGAGKGGNGVVAPRRRPGMTGGIVRSPGPRTGGTPGQGQGRPGNGRGKRRQ